MADDFAGKVVIAARLAVSGAPLPARSRGGEHQWFSLI